MELLSEQAKLRIIDKHISELSLSYEGIYIWPYIRSKLALLLLQKKTDATYEKSKFQWQMLLVFTLSLFNCIRLCFSKTNIRHIYFNSSSGVFKDGGDYLDSYSGYSYKVRKDVLFFINIANFSDLNSYIHLFLFKNVISDNGFFKLISLIRKPFTAKHIFKNDWAVSSADIQATAALINQQFPELVSENQIRGYVVEYCSQYLTYCWLLNPFKGTEAEIISSYSKVPLVSALNTLNCPLSEIQHGVGGEYHVGYNAVQSLTCSTVKYPRLDSIHVYNDFWADSFQKCDLFKNSFIHIAGNKKLELATRGELPSSLMGRKYILITGQGQFHQQLAELVTLFLDSEPEKYLVLYRPHPKEANELLEHLEPSSLRNFIYFDDKSILTELLIKECFIHVSIYSACHFDAMHLKGKSFCFDIIDDSPIEPYVRNNKAFIKFSNAKVLLSLIGSEV